MAPNAEKPDMVNSVRQRTDEEMIKWIMKAYCPASIAGQ